MEDAKWRAGSLEERVVRHCAPTLAGIKCGSMFMMRSAKDEVLGDVRRLNRETSGLGVIALVLKAGDDGALVYVYRPGMLSEVLSDRRVRSFLEGLGYRDGSAPSLIRTLSERFGRERMPHEVGIFLGYPLEDVVGFIEKGGRGCSRSGCWKCYGDPARAEAMFERCKDCSARCSRIYMEGGSLGSLCARPAKARHRLFIRHTRIGMAIAWTLKC